MSYQVGILMLECCGFTAAPYATGPTSSDPIYKYLYPELQDESAFFSKLSGNNYKIPKEVKAMILALIQPDPAHRENLHGILQYLDQLKTSQKRQRPNALSDI